MVSSAATIIRGVELLPTQEDAVFRLVVQARHDPSDFELRQAYDERLGAARELARDGTPYYFRFLTSRSGGRLSEYSPGRASVVERALAKTWGAQTTSVLAWLGYLGRELQAQNLWADAGAGRDVLAAVEAGVAGEPFTPAERERIRAFMVDAWVPNLIAEARTDADAEAMQDAVAELVGERLEKESRRTWVWILVGALVDWSTGRLAEAAVVPLYNDLMLGLHHAMALGGELPH